MKKRTVDYGPNKGKFNFITQESYDNKNFLFLFWFNVPATDKGTVAIWRIRYKTPATTKLNKSFI